MNDPFTSADLTVTAADLNSDGAVESLVTDCDGDFVADAVLSDLDGDGITDVGVFDTNADGYFDVVGIDTSRYGVADVVIVDSDYDGSADTVLVAAGAAAPAATVPMTADCPETGTSADIYPFTGSDGGTASSSGGGYEVPSQPQAVPDLAGNGMKDPIYPGVMDPGPVPAHEVTAANEQVISRGNDMS